MKIYKIYKSSYLITLLTIAVALIGCVRTHSPSTKVAPELNREVAFATGVPIIEMNTIIKLKLAAEQDNNPKIGSFVDLTVENQSAKRVWFPVDFGNKLLLYSTQKEEWIKVENHVIYRAVKDIILDPKGKGLFDQDPISVWPDLTNTGQSVNIRVVVIGKIYKDNAPSNEQVGAYIDITLQP